MIRISGFIRNAPKLFYVVAALDFLKYMLGIAQYFSEGRFDGIDVTMGIRLQLFSIFLSAIIFAAGWIAYGIVATLLIALYDEVVALRAAAEDASNA